MKRPALLRRLRRKRVNDEKLLIGWSEWCQLPTLHIPAIKAKIDTGAKTSAIHAFNIQRVEHHHRPFVQFDIHPIQHNDKIIVPCRAPIIDERYVMSSTGHKEYRYVIITTLQLGNQSWEIELTLSNRELLRFRMLLGREALKKRVHIDPAKYCVQKRINKSMLLDYYRTEKNQALPPR